MKNSIISRSLLALTLAASLGCSSLSAMHFLRDPFVEKQSYLEAISVIKADIQIAYYLFRPTRPNQQITRGTIELFEKELRAQEKIAEREYCSIIDSLINVDDEYWVAHSTSWKAVFNEILSVHQRVWREMELLFNELCEVFQANGEDLQANIDRKLALTCPKTSKPNPYE